MTLVLLLLLAGLALWGVVASIVVALRDGYRRQPVHLPQDDRDYAPDVTRAEPSDLVASQWLSDRTDRRGRQIRRIGRPAGVMLFRP